MTGSVVDGGVLTDVAARLDQVSLGLHARLAQRPPEEHEQDAGPALAALKQAGATAMLIPAAYGGLGVSTVDAVRFQAALGSLAPSAAIATTMHHYKIAALGNVATSGSAPAAAILAGLADGAKLMASGGAESTPGHDLRSLGSWAVRDGDAYRINGVKRPCSLSASMDVMSLMVELRGPDGEGQGFAQAFVPAGSEGLRREPFWRSPVFLAAQSHAVHLDDVHVAGSHVFPLHGQVGRQFAADCYAYFQLLISAAYLGVAGCVAAATPIGRQATSTRWTRAADRLGELEAGVVAAARALDDGRPSGERLNLAVRARDAVEDAIGAVGGDLLRAAGGGTFATTGFYTTLAGALHALAFHPPARGAREGTGLEELDPQLREAR